MPEPTPVHPEIPLFDHGIYTERSDIRAHVSPLEKTVYVFRTAEGIRAIEKYDPPFVDGFQNGVTGRTATGWLVRPKWIDDIRELKFFYWSGWSEYNPNWNTSRKGKFAVTCVQQIMRLGRFPVWLDWTEEHQNKELQIDGTDILIFCKKKVQVKCDQKVAEKGNLFLQKAERNPLRLR